MLEQGFDIKVLKTQFNNASHHSPSIEKPLNPLKLKRFNARKAIKAARVKFKGHRKRGVKRDLTYRKWYHQVYLKSDHWVRVRANYILDHGPLCELCKHSPGTELHHVSYKKLFHETDADLRFLCIGCHDGIHGYQKHLD
jgi:hypothetical protein